MRTFFVTLAAVCLWIPVLAEEEAPTQEGKAPLMVSFADLKWTALPERKGMQIAVLSGDPKKGAYTQMRKVPAGTDNPLHTHSSELTNVIISGVWYTGADTASARDFGPGSVVRMPANWVHVSGCRAGSECVFYQEGKGKFDFKPVAQAPCPQVVGGFAEDARRRHSAVDTARLTIVGGDRERSALRAAGAGRQYAPAALDRALLGGPSTSPLERGVTLP